LVLRMPLMIQMLATAMTRAGSADPLAVARALEGMRFDGEGFHPSTMRAADHQLIQPLYAMEMDKAGTPGVGFDNEGDGQGGNARRRIRQRRFGLRLSHAAHRSRRRNRAANDVQDGAAFALSVGSARLRRRAV